VPLASPVADQGSENSIEESKQQVSLLASSAPSQAEFGTLKNFRSQSILHMPFADATPLVEADVKHRVN
jgi:hypothetical protein